MRREWWKRRGEAARAGGRAGGRAGRGGRAGLRTSRPPTSSHEQSGISTALSRSDDGAVFDIAKLKWSVLITIESRVS